MILTGLAVGIPLGAVMQRGRFCVTNMIRDIWLNGKFRAIVALFIVISVHAIGLAALTSAGIIQPDNGTFAPIGVIIGGLLFGVGIVLAGGCASGTWYRSGEGLVGSWIALIMYGISAAAMKYGMLKDFKGYIRSWDTGWTTLPKALGISAWWFVIPFSVLTAYLAVHFLRKDAGLAKAKLEQAWYRRPLHTYLAGLLIGVLGVIAWPLSAATGRNGGLGITTPSADTLSFVTTGDETYLNWGVMLVLGLLLGSYLAAKVTGEFRVRVPDARTVTHSIWGGVLMGVGASLAGGCTVGNGMVETSLFSFQGWVALAAIALGIGLGVKVWVKPSSNPERALKAEEEHEPTAAERFPQFAEIRPAGATSTSGAGTFVVATGLVSVATRPKISDSVEKRDAGRYYIDTLGAVCPFPLVEAKDVMNRLKAGDELVIAFDCTQATDSIPQWAADEGHSVHDFKQTQNAGWEITVRKGGATT